MGKKFTIYDTEADYDTEEARTLLAEREDVPVEEISDERVADFINDDAEFAFECEYDNLNAPLEGKILAIADLGLWNGRVWGYALLPENLNQIMRNGNADSFSVFSDGKDIRKIAHHHDGTNYILYREVRKGVNIDNLTTRIWHNETIDRKTLNYYTKSLLPKVVEIYGK